MSIVDTLPLSCSDNGNPPPAPAAEEVAEHVLRLTLARLRAGQGREAVRLFVDASAHAWLPNDVNLKSWVRVRTGDGLVRQLVSSMAAYPCFACDGGSERCAGCERSGFIGFAMPCPACLGFGRSRCDFCDGSGLATYNLFPGSFRSAIVSKRVTRALKALDLLVEQSASHRRDPADVARELALLYNVNRIVGVLENAVVVAEQLVRANQCRPESLARLRQTCATASGRAFDEIHVLLRRLAEAQRHVAAVGDDDQRSAAALADYLEQLSTSADFEGTPLHHPFLVSRRERPAAPASAPLAREPE